MKSCDTCKYQGGNILVAIFMDSGSQDCHSPKAKVDPVTGKPEKIACFIQRKYEWSCGREGKWHSDYEDKP
jgi:hypothetical protein